MGGLLTQRLLVPAVGRDIVFTVHGRGLHECFCLSYCVFLLRGGGRERGRKRIGSVVAGPSLTPTHAPTHPSPCRFTSPPPPPPPPPPLSLSLYPQTLGSVMSDWLSSHPPPSLPPPLHSLLSLSLSLLQWTLKGADTHNIRM